MLQMPRNLAIWSESAGDQIGLNTVGDAKRSATKLKNIESY